MLLLIDMLTDAKRILKEKRNENANEKATIDHPAARTIPIIAMTANAFAEDVQASLDAGMNGHLSKPIVLEEASPKVKTTCIRHRCVL